MKTYFLTCCALVLTLVAVGLAADPREFGSGGLIPDQGYCDQPYIVQTKDGNWLCTLTTGPGKEGQIGQHVAAAISRDKGRTWSELIDIEPSDGPEASWVVPLVVPSGRVYALYDYNGDRVDTLRGKKTRADMLGWYVYRYSDDHGRTWSHERYRLPMRLTACDRGNDWQGRVQIFWGIDKPIVVGESALFAFTKLGKYMLENGEGWLYRSDNILTEPEVSKIRWQLLPEGEHGIRAEEFGSVQEEHNVVPLANGDLYCIYRTTLGYPCHSYSRDGGRSWTKPEPATYRPGGRKLRTPRACPMLWRTADGRFLFWYHNNGHRSFNSGKVPGNRNLAWLSGGLEKDGSIHWSQPELVCYVQNPRQGCSYPDLIEADGEYYISSTQKTEARVLHVDKGLVEGLWRQETIREAASDGLVLSLGGPSALPERVKMPRLPPLNAGGSFSLEMWIELESFEAGQVLLDSRSGDGRGIAVTTAADNTLRIDIGDGKSSAGWGCDPGMLKPGALHHVVFIVDGGPKLISVVVDGLLCDGGDDVNRPYGYGRFVQTQYADRSSDAVAKAADELGDVSGGNELAIAPMPRKWLKHLRIYDRYLRITEAIGNYRAGLPLRGGKS